MSCQIRYSRCVKTDSLDVVALHEFLQVGALETEDARRRCGRTGSIKARKRVFELKCHDGFVAMHECHSITLAALANSKRLPLSAVETDVSPVMFPPGRSRLETIPLSARSAPAVMTMAIVVVAFLAA